MKILVIGSGGREHALCRAFRRSPKVEKLYCADGNAGIGEIAELVDIKPDEINRLADFAAKNAIDLTFVGGETALAAGIADEFSERGLPIIGASQKASRLEASKAFAKDFMRRHNIPTAIYEVADSVKEARQILDGGAFGDRNAPVVIKADGLAAGKGVVVAKNRSEAITAVNDLENLVGKDASAKIVIEEFLSGREVSLIMFADGESFALMPPVRDHKRIGEGDTGANTGGMGTVADGDLLTETQFAEVTEKIIVPTLRGCMEEDFSFRGILFLGLMLTEAGIKVLEYNVRFGDPETQAILVLLETDLTEICSAMLDGKLNDLEIKWRDENAACVVLASAGYPQKAQTGDIINGLTKANQEPDVVVFHAGTAKNADDEFITAGGRVLGVTATAKNLTAALKKVYSAVEKISWNGMQFRRDIGK